MGILVVLVVLIVLGIVAAGILRAKSRMQYADEMASMRALSGITECKFPSWNKDKHKVQMFHYALSTVPLRDGVPKSYVDLCLNTEMSVKLLLTFAAEMEQRGSSFATQQSGAAGLLTKMWERLSHSDQMKFIESSNNGK